MKTGLISLVSAVSLAFVALLTPADAQYRPGPGAGAPQRVSVAADGTQANGASDTPALSADGRFVALRSAANNLVPDMADPGDHSDVYLYDRQITNTSWLSAPYYGQPRQSFAWEPQISANGRYVAFVSTASNLVPSDTNTESDIFFYDRLDGRRTRVSLGPGGSEGNGGSWMPAISADGRYVAFASDATTLVEDDTAECNDKGYVYNCSDVFVRDLRRGVTTLVSVTSDGRQADGDSFHPGLSADGRYVVFASDATNLHSGPSPTCEPEAYSPPCSDIFVHDRTTGETIAVSVASDGTLGNGHSGIYTGGPSISADGRSVAFVSFASNLVASDTNKATDVFVHDRRSGQTSRVSVASDGAEGNRFSSYFDAPAISADGRYVAFLSNASNLVPNDTNGAADVFVHDRVAGRTVRVSIGAYGVQGNGAAVFSPALSGDGRWVAFASEASNLVAGDTNGVADVFVREWAAPMGSVLYLPLGQYEFEIGD